jgi:molybdate transport system ATP-binding protein
VVESLVSSSAQGLDAHLVVQRTAGFTLDLALRIHPGSTAVLLGPNGAGKSTAAWAVAGLIPLDQGSVMLNGRTLDDPYSGILVPPEDRNVGLVFQDHLLFPHLTATDNVAFGLRSHGMARRKAEQRAGEWLNRMGLAHIGDRRATELSGGQAQRVALARALAIEPDLLVLDEPLSALDVTTRAETRRALTGHLVGFTGPRLVITHDPTEAFLLGDEVFVLEDGLLSQSGSPEEIRRKPRTRYAADLVGINLVTGFAGKGVVTTAEGHNLHVADQEAAGPVLATIHPRAVMLLSDPPSGSPRNVWATRVVSIEPAVDRTRVVLDRPLALTAEVTPAAVTEMGLREGEEVWAAVKATEIEVAPG